MRENKALKNRKKLVLDLISSKNYVPMRFKDIAVLLSVPSPKRHELKEVLEALVDDGKVVLNVDGRYVRNRGAIPQNSYDQGAGRRDARRFGDPGQGPDYPGSGRDGRYEKNRSNVRDGRYGKYGTNGKHGKNQGRGSDKKEKKERIETLSIDDVAEVYHLPSEFPEKVQNQADRCPDTLVAGDMSGRSDLRDLLMVTIDGEDARDLDDAVSLDFDGTWYILGVHIADVTNYVQAGSALDQEALNRGTSVYLPDRVIPMLPKKLSNGICSLNAGEDRLALSCIMQIDQDGVIHDHKIAETVIHVDERMTYTAVDAILSEPESHPELMERYAEEVPMFRLMRELSAKLRANRKMRGAIDFDFPESQVILDAEGTPIEIRPHLATTATRIIEDFMLAANETVAREYCSRDIPFLYRVHDEPDQEKMEDTLSLIRKQGIKVEKGRRNITPKEVNHVLEQVAGDPREAMVSRALLRSMAKAVYSPECSGHYGLAAEYYCHFTSPIRRYPDLQIHRIIKDDLRGRLDKGNRTAKYRALLPNVAIQSSSMEQRAQEAEREAVKLKKAEYMQEHIGEEFEGVISGVTNWGFYVELTNTVEGLVPVVSLSGDYYYFNEDECCLTGRKTGRVFTLGQPVKIRVKYAEAASRMIDFELAES